MQVQIKYDATLPRAVAELIHQHGLIAVLSEFASYCEVEWIQAAQRSEPAEQWRNASEVLSQIVEDWPMEESTIEL